MGFWSHIKDEWATLIAAPVAFIGLAVLSAVGGYAVGFGMRGQEVANLESLIRLKDGELSGLSKQLEERIKKVEDTLSAQQVSALESSLSTNPSKVEFRTWIDSAASEPQIAGQLESIFKDSGWQVVPGSQTTEPTDWANMVLLAAPDDANGAAIKAAFEAADLPYDLKTLAAGETPQVWLKAQDGTAP
jgi:hypothetical protein